MDRRDFLRKATALSVGFLAIPSIIALMLFVPFVVLFLCGNHIPCSQSSSSSETLFPNKSSGFHILLKPANSFKSAKMRCVVRATFLWRVLL